MNTRRLKQPGSSQSIRIQSSQLPWQYLFLKRGVDLLVALASLIIALPVMAVIAILIRLDSPGPLLFRQERVGRDGGRFNMYKFRSMRQDAEELKAKLEAQNEASGLMFKMHDDPRVTRVGRVIRRLSLDELPQLFNVVNGSMSIVGPRPPLPIEVALYESRHLERLKGIPGITGLWQIRRGDTIDFEEMVALDIEYLDNWSLLSDIAIILKTVPAMLKGRGAS